MQLPRPFAALAMRWSTSRRLAGAVLATGLLALACQPAVAQRGFQLGLRAYPQWTFLNNSMDAGLEPDSFSRRMTVSMAVALNAGWGFNNNMSAHGQLIYSDQGQDHFYTTTNSVGDTIRVISERNLGYLKIPLLFRYQTNADRKFSYFGEVGPQFAVLLSVNEQDNDPNYRPSRELLQQSDSLLNYPDLRDVYNNFDMGLVVAGGVDVKLRFNLKLNLMARLDWGWLDVENKGASYQRRDQGTFITETYYAPDRGATTNLAISLGIGFTYVFIPSYHY